MHARAPAPPHVVAGFTVPRVMFQVLAALVPVAAVQVYLHGPGPLWLIATGSVTALACEALALRLRRRPSSDFLRDGSVLVTAALLALAVPPTLPWWLMGFGTAVAVLVAKHAYGGLGQNPFNPAMVGYAVLLVSFPLEMTRWPAAGAAWDTVTGATFHLATGATMLGAFFIATDPVSAATSDRGRLVFGAGVGLTTWIIRSWGGFPDGVAFAVLLMNLAVPLIDRYTVPRIYGHPGE